MKLQYLGDARDAFKWDLLHWICTASRFSQLIFVPLLTPDRPGSGEGLIPHERFRCQDFLRSFLESLKEEPRLLSRISGLGSIHPKKSFEVQIFAPEKFVGAGGLRSEYWTGLAAAAMENSVVFFDPDNGFETKTQNGPQWLRHAELKNLFQELPESSVALVYQHRPHRTWKDVFADLSIKLDYVDTAVAVYESDLAFVALAYHSAAGKDIMTILEKYVADHTAVHFIKLRENGSPCG